MGARLWGGYENQFVCERVFTNLQLVEPLNPRDSFFGGRTNGVRLHYKVDEGENIKYIDINSLYPYVNKTKTYPVGYPEILVNPTDQEVDSYFGAEKVRILAPPRLYHPVLPVRVGDKLTFPLCSKCAEQQRETPWLKVTEFCSHTDVERVMIGTWCTTESQKAKELGYRILKIYEVWNFPENQRKEGLFADYVNKWLKNKTEATGWPKNCVTEEAKTTYVADYYDSEGVQLEPNKIEKNSGRKQVAKLMLNSFWGYFGEKPNKTQTLTVTSPGDLFDIIEEAGNNIHDIRICTEDIVELNVSKVEEEIIPGSITNIFIASFMTSWASLELYKYLEQLKKQVLYFDTDSIMYFGVKAYLK